MIEIELDDSVLGTHPQAARELIGSLPVRGWNLGKLALNRTIGSQASVGLRFPTSRVVACPTCGAAPQSACAGKAGHLVHPVRQRSAERLRHNLTLAYEFVTWDGPCLCRRTVEYAPEDFFRDMELLQLLGRARLVSRATWLLYDRDWLDLRQLSNIVETTVRRASPNTEAEYEKLSRSPNRAWHLRREGALFDVARSGDHRASELVMREGDLSSQEKVAWRLRASLQGSASQTRGLVAPILAEGLISGVAGEWCIPADYWRFCTRWFRADWADHGVAVPLLLDWARRLGGEQVLDEGLLLSESSRRDLAKSSIEALTARTLQTNGLAAALAAAVRMGADPNESQVLAGEVVSEANVAFEGGSQDEIGIEVLRLASRMAVGFPELQLDPRVAGAYFSREGSSTQLLETGLVYLHAWNYDHVHPHRDAVMNALTARSDQDLSPEAHLVGQLLVASAQANPADEPGRAIDEYFGAKPAKRLALPPHLLESFRAAGSVWAVVALGPGFVGGGKASRKRSHARLGELIADRLDGQSLDEFRPHLKRHGWDIQRVANGLENKQQKERQAAAKKERDRHAEKVVERLLERANAETPDWEAVAAALEELWSLDRDRCQAVCQQLARDGRAAQLRMLRPRNDKLLVWLRTHFGSSLPSLGDPDQASRLTVGVKDILNLPATRQVVVPDDEAEAPVDDQEASESALDESTEDVAVCRKVLYDLLRVVGSSQQGDLVDVEKLQRALVSSRCKEHPVPPERGADAEFWWVRLLFASEELGLQLGQEGLMVTEATARLSKEWANRFAPFDFDAVRSVTMARAELSLWPWQREALESWAAHGRQGVIEAATGAGKTRVGIAAALEGYARGLLVIVVVPRRVLLDQWYESFSQYVTPSTLSRLSTDYKDEGVRYGILIAVVNSLVSRFEGGYPTDTNVLLVADEVHRYESSTSSQQSHGRVLDRRFPERMGLTATLEGSPVAEYFDGTVYRLDHAAAIDQGVVSPYRLLLVGFPLNPDEFRRYKRHSSQMRSAGDDLGYRAPGLDRLKGRFLEYKGEIRRLTRSADPDVAAAAEKWAASFETCMEILSNSKGKADGIEALVPAIEQASGALVFTMWVHAANNLAEKLRRRNLRAESVSGDTEAVDRKRVLSNLESGELGVVVSPRILDEGVDIPDVDLAIVVENSSRQRQLVQRLGRILRLKQPGSPLPVFVVFFSEGTLEDPTAIGDQPALLDQVVRNADEVLVARRSVLGEHLGAEILEFFTSELP